MVYNLCLNYTQNKESAEDVMQNTFVTIHQKLDKFDGKSSLKTWVYRVTINQNLDYIKAQNRKKRKGKTFSLFGDKGAVYEPGEFDHPGVKLESTEAIKQIMQTINQLAPNQKTALLLKIQDDLPVKEIAVIMETSEKAVGSLLSRAKENLRKMNITEGFK